MTKNKKIKSMLFTLAISLSSVPLTANAFSLSVLDISSPTVEKKMKAPVKNIGRNDMYRSVNPKVMKDYNEKKLRYNPDMLTLHDANMNQ